MKSLIISTTANAISSGGTISGDVTISGDLTVNGDGSGTYDEIISGGLHIQQSSSGGTANTSADDLVIESSGDTGMSILSGTSSNGFIFFADSGDDNIAGFDYDHQLNKLNILVNAATRMAIDSSGNVGIGTNAPSGLTHIKSGSGIHSSGTHADADELTIEGSGHAGLTIFAGTSSNSNVFFGDSGSQYTGIVRYSHSDDSMQFYTIASEKVRITSAGELLVGDTSGSAKLNVKHTASNYPVLLLNHDSSATTTVSNRSAYIDFDKTSNTASGQTISMSGLQIDMNNDSATDVGTTNLTGLDVNMTMGTSGTQKAVGLDVSVSGADTNYAALFSGGNIGIGISTPTNFIEIHDGASMGFFDHDYTGFVTQNAGESPRQTFIRSRGSNASPTAITSGDVLGEINFYGSASNNALRESAKLRVVSEGTIGTNSVPTYFAFLTTNEGATSITEKMRIDRSGQVGIGETSPDTMLHLTSATDAKPVITIEQSGNNVNGGAIIFNSSNAANVDDVSGTIRFKANNSVGDSEEYATIFEKHSNVTNASEVGQLHFKVRGSGDDLSSRLLLDGNSRISLSNNDNNTANTVFGKTAFNAGSDNASDWNVAVGELAMGTGAVAGATYNTAVGYKALTDITAGDNNTAIGANALGEFLQGHHNTAMGNSALGNLKGDIYANAGFNNVAIGSLAMRLVESGTHANSEVEDNIAIGYDALKGGDFDTNDRDLIGNIAIGSYALDATDTNAHTGTIAIGHNALTALTSGASNTAVGYKAGEALVEGGSNTAIGFEALKSDTTGGNSVAVGSFALNEFSKAGTGGGVAGNVAVGSASMRYLDNANAIGNTAVGFGSLAGTNQAGVTPHSNVAVGYDALNLLIGGTENVAIGYKALDAQAGESGDGATNDGHRNIAIGADAMGAVNAGTHNSAEVDDNIAIGNDALLGASFGSGDKQLVGNIAIGSQALDATDSNEQTGTIAIGHEALTALTTGASNLAIGYQAGMTMTTATQNLLIGYQAGYLMLDNTRNVCIGNTAGGFLGSDEADENIFIGTNAGASGEWDDTNSNTANQNVGIGVSAMGGVGGNDAAHFTAANNVALGFESLKAITTGGSNVAVGSGAGDAMGAGDGNVIIGVDAFGAQAGASPNYNVVIGHGAGSLANHADVDSNVLIGHDAGKGGGNGMGNCVAIGAGAMDGSAANSMAGIVAVGKDALGASITAGANYSTAVGKGALSAVTSGASNQALGVNAGSTVTTGSYNTLIGREANVAGNSDGYNTVVGNQAVASGNFNTVLGEWGIIKYKTRRITITAAHSGVNSIIEEVCKIPALSIIHRVTCTVITKSTDVNPYTLNLQLSTSSGTAADGALANASTTITVPEILGADGVATYAQNSGTVLGTAADILAGTGGVNNTVYTSMPTTTIVGTADTYLYVCNAVDNGTSASSGVVLDICVEYQGTD